MIAFGMVNVSLPHDYNQNYKVKNINKKYSFLTFSFREKRFWENLILKIDIKIWNIKSVT